MGMNKTNGRYENTSYTIVLEPSEPVDDPEVGKIKIIDKYYKLCPFSFSVN